MNMSHIIHVYFCWIFLILSLFYCSTSMSESRLCNTFLTTEGNRRDYNVSETIHFSCRVEAESSPNITLLSLVYKSLHNPDQIIIPFHHMTNSTGHVDVEVKSAYQAEGTYTCIYNHCDRLSMDSFLSVYVLKWEVKFECILDDLYNMTCDWASNELSQIISWELYCTRRPRQHQNDSSVFPCCPRTNHDTSTFCRLKEEDVFLFYEYNMTLIKSSLETKQTFYFTIITDETIVRISVNVEKVIPVSSSQLIMEIFMSDSPSAFNDKVCNLTLSSEWEQHKLMNREDSFSNKSLVNNLTVSGLEPFTTYNMSVVCKLVRSQYWSQIVYLKGRTLAAVPEHVPSVISFSDVTDIDQHWRQIYLFFEPLPPRQWYGNQAKYIVSIGNLTCSFEADTVTGILSETFALDNSLKLTIQTQNEKGSTNASVYEIPSQLRTGLVSVSIVARLSESGATVYLFADEIHDITNVAYYWCQCDFQCTVPPICKTNLSKTTVSGYKRSHDLETSTAHPKMPMHFGAAISTSLATSGIKWADCVFSNKHRTEEILQIFAMRSHNTSVVNVTLLFEFCKLRQMPLQYQVAVSVGSSENNTVYNTSVSYDATPSSKYLLVSSDPRDNLSLSVQVIYHDGQSDSSNAFLLPAALTANSPVSDIVINNPTLAIVLGSVLCAIVTIIVVSMLIKKIKQRLEKSFSIDTQWIKYPPQETYNVVFENTNDTRVQFQSNSEFSNNTIDVSVPLLEPSTSQQCIQDLKTSPSSNTNSNISNQSECNEHSQDSPNERSQDSPNERSQDSSNERE